MAARINRSRPLFAKVISVNKGAKRLVFRAVCKALFAKKVGDFDKKGTSKPSVFNGLEIPRVYILFKEEGIMKRQWLSIVLVLCMVLCMAPATARAEESKTGTLKITVDISGVYEGDNVGDKTFSFEILRKYANYGHYKYVDITIKPGETEGTMDVPVEEGKYVVKQTGHATIDKYDWENASHQPGNNIESNEQEVFADKTKSVTVHNFYKLAVTKEITELPITVTGYALGAKVGDIKASTDQMRVDIHKVTIKQRNASGGWDDLASDATIQANTQYAVEIFVNAKPEYTYTELTKDKVTVNGKEASVFENPSTQSGGDMRVFYELEVLEVVKTVESIEITTPPAKTEYKAGEKFDPTGMVVTAHYTDGTTADLSRDKYVIFYGDKLTQGQTDVTIQYNDGSGNSDIKVRQTITVGAYEGPHTHTYGGPWYADAKSHWHQCTDSACPDPSGSTKDLASHTFVWKVDKAATETQTGLKHEECTVCKKVLETATIPATGSTHTHSYGTDWKYDDTNHWHECECRDKADTAAHSFQWVIDKAATKKATGIKHEECTVCGAKRSENTVIAKLSDSGSTGNTGSGNNNTDKLGKDDSTKSPQTGDSSNLIGWLAALFVSGGVLTVLGLNGKKRKESEAE